MGTIEFLRAFIRPFLQLLLGSTLIGVAAYLAIKYADAELAKYIITGVLGAGIALIGSYAGERSIMRKMNIK